MTRPASEPRPWEIVVCALGFCALLIVGIFFCLAMIWVVG